MPFFTTKVHRSTQSVDWLLRSFFSTQKRSVRLFVVEKNNMK
ncbi:MAG: hypothetical protein RIR11_3778 [Bacteroidota bacterium]|jgi:hypothetical protein